LPVFEIPFNNNTIPKKLGCWQQIEISVVDAGRTKVVISRNRWIWVLKNLVFPFVGFFVVLSVLYLATLVSGAIFLRMANKP